MLHFISKSSHASDEDFLFSLSFCIIAVAGSPCYINVYTLYFFCGPLWLLVLVFKNFVSLWVCNVYSGHCEFMVNDLKINLISSLIQQCIIQGGSNMTGTVFTCLHTNQSRSYLNHLVHNKWEFTFGQFLIKLWTSLLARKLRCHGQLRSELWYFLTNVSGPISPIFKHPLTLEDGTDRLSQNVDKELPLLAT